MQKIFLTIGFVFLTLLSGYSQYGRNAKEKFASKYGVKLASGAVLVRSESSQIGNARDYVVYEVEVESTTPQFAIGGFASKRFGWLYTEGTAMVSRYGVNYNVDYFKEGDKIREVRSEDFTYVDLQVLGGLTDNGFRIGVGPVVHILAHQNSEMLTLENYNQVLRNVSYGFTGLIGYYYGRFGIELKYDKAFRTIGDHVYYGVKKSQYKETPDALSLQIAYIIH
jgi:hypothetical protein